MNKWEHLRQEHSDLYSSMYNTVLKYLDNLVLFRLAFSEDLSILFTVPRSKEIEIFSLSSVGSVGSHSSYNWNRIKSTCSLSGETGCAYSDSSVQDACSAVCVQPWYSR